MTDNTLYPCAVQAARGGTRPPGCTCRIRRVTTQGRALRACGPELDDMNAVIPAAPLPRGQDGGGLIPAGRGFLAERIDPPLILVKGVLVAAGTAVMFPFPGNRSSGVFVESA